MTEDATAGRESAGDAFDREAYFRRIGFTGEAAPTLPTLAAIVAGHTAAIPFENLDPLLGRPVSLDIGAIQRKLVAEERGGYCYEQNLLLRRALEDVGFTVTGLAARVLWGRPPGVVSPRTHALLRVQVDGEDFLADAGFGSFTLTAPLRLVPETEQETPHETFRLCPSPGGFTLEAQVRGEWKPIYRFSLTEEFPCDYEMGNFYVSNNPASQFVNILVAGRPAPGRRYVLRKNEFAIHHRGGETERRTVASAGELRELLSGPFGIRLPDTPALDPLLERLMRDTL